MRGLLSEHTKAQKQFLVQILFATIFTTLTGGAFLSGLAAYLGADDMLVSYISIIPNLCGVFVLLFAPWLGRVQNQKRLTVALTAASRLATASVVLIPLLAPGRGRLGLLVPVVLAAFTLQGLATVSLNNWMVYYTPAAGRGRYISLRQTVLLLTSMTLSVLAGRYLDAAPTEYFGFAVLFSAGLGAGLVEVALLCRMDAACLTPPARVLGAAEKAVPCLLKNRPFLRYLALIFFFYLFLYIGDSFSFVFLFRYLKLPYGAITTLQLLITLPQLFLLSLWGKISDRVGHRRALNASIWFFLGETGFFFLTSTKGWFVTVPIAYLIASVANAGFSVAVFNRRYELIPAENRILCDSVFQTAVGAAFLLGPLLGGALRDAVSNAGLLRGVMEFPEIRLLYAAATVGILVMQLVSMTVRRREKAHGLA